MVRYVVIICVLFLSGCVSSPDKAQPLSVPTKGSYRTDNALRISQLNYGMAKEQVHALMKDGLVVAMERQENDQWASDTMANPLQAQVIHYDGSRYDVYYYFTEIKNRNGRVDLDELTPVVFKDGVLIGKTHEDLQKYLPGLAKDNE